jgi:hypothetical protein
MQFWGSTSFQPNHRLPRTKLHTAQHAISATCTSPEISTTKYPIYTRASGTKAKHVHTNINAKHGMAGVPKHAALCYRFSLQCMGQHLTMIFPLSFAFDNCAAYLASQQNKSLYAHKLYQDLIACYLSYYLDPWQKTSQPLFYNEFFIHFAMMAPYFCGPYVTTFATMMLHSTKISAIKSTLHD